MLPALGSDTSSLASRGCARLSRHQYEVCCAYLVNDSLLARVPYYRLGRQPVLGPLALARLNSRHYGAARRFLIGQTKGWPRQADVSVPAIRIVGPVRVSADLATATITTIETWLVRTEPQPGGKTGRVLFAQTSARHTVTLDRTPHHPLPGRPLPAQMGGGADPVTRHAARSPHAPVPAPAAMTAPSPRPSASLNGWAGWPPGGCPCTGTTWTRAWERVVSAGAGLIYPPEDQSCKKCGGRPGGPFGQHWMMSQHTGDIPAGQMARRAAPSSADGGRR